MSGDHFVIIGNGPAGNQAALSLRERVPDARITLVSKDEGGSYRPHLLPRFIAGQIGEEELYVSTVDVYRERGIKLRSGQRVVDADLSRRRLVLDHKEVIPFTGLIIAVGGTPRIPEHLIVFQDLMLTLKTLQDARRWIERLNRVDSVLMIGGDLTSLAMTRALLQCDKRIYFMLNEDAFWPLRCNGAMFEKVTERLTEAGVEVLSDRRLKGVARLAEDQFEVQVGERLLEVGLIGAFFGLRPDIGFLAGSGLRIDRGILVDPCLCTGFEGIYATGDCAQIYHPALRDYWVSIGHDNARALGRIAAFNLAGGRVQADVGAKSIFEADGIKVNTSWWAEF